MDQLLQVKNSVRKDTNKVAVGVIIYTVILMATVLVFALVSIVIAAVQDPDTFFNSNEAFMKEFSDQLFTHATSSIVGVLLGTLFLFLFFKKDMLVKRIFVTAKPMSLSAFVQILFVFLGVQLILNLFITGAEALSNFFGFTTVADIESATGDANTVSMFLYASFIGPVIEELVFRGFLMRKLEPHGKTLAIVVSSILFGFMHMNLYQNIFGILIGLVLAYTAFEYGIKWSILLHIINNFVLAWVLPELTADLSVTTQNIVLLAIEILFFVGGLFILILKRAKIKEYIAENKITDNKLKYALTSVGIIIYIAVCVIASLPGIAVL